MSIYAFKLIALYVLFLYSRLNGRLEHIKDRVESVKLILIKSLQNVAFRTPSSQITDNL